MSARYPFSAIAGQEELKQALLLTAVDPLIGGLLAFGDRGTGKSTAVRALAARLPQRPHARSARSPFRSSTCRSAPPKTGFWVP